jgi:arylsulfatase A-like enzyme
MSNRTAVFKGAAPAGSSSPTRGAHEPGPWSLLLLSSWCGLVAGLLEVATIFIRKRWFDSNHLYGMSRHFVWLIPVTNVVIFACVGMAAFLIAMAWSRRGRWLTSRALGALTLLPAVLVAFPRIYGLAWVMVLLGVAVWMVPVLERRTAGVRWLLLWSLPAAAGLLLLGGSTWMSGRLALMREASRLTPPPGAPNVLLIVMDAVAAGHLSTHGYERSTSRTLAELAQRGISFQNAQAVSSWTLPSHASLFTGRWPHDLSAGWLTPLDRTHPTLAEFLGASGYATAGFVANNQYCAADSGLNRGFDQYEDFIFPELTALKMAVLVNRFAAAAHTTIDFLDEWLDLGPVRPAVKKALKSLDADRKEAAMVNRQLLDWLSQRPQAERPFFAFLNYFDAHFPYQLPPERIHRFGSNPSDQRDRELIDKWWDTDKTGVSPRDIALARDAYDDCIADLDEQIGRLFDELEHRGELERTWVFITADHGESFGEHPGVFCHGTSLYQTELHVPLIIIPPGGIRANRLVDDRVSLRDLAATVVDVVGLDKSSPFPGRSLARFWDDAPHPPAADGLAPRHALAEVVPIDPVFHDVARLAHPAWPMAALAEGDWSYIRRHGHRGEELFDLHGDANEQRNRADDPAAQPRLGEMRRSMDRLTAGPLTPERFRP